MVTVQVSQTSSAIIILTAAAAAAAARRAAAKTAAAATTLESSGSSAAGQRNAAGRTRRPGWRSARPNPDSNFMQAAVPAPSECGPQCSLARGAPRRGAFDRYARRCLDIWRPGTKDGRRSFATPPCHSTSILAAPPALSLPISPRAKLIAHAAAIYPAIPGPSDLNQCA